MPDTAHPKRRRLVDGGFAVLFAITAAAGMAVAARDGIGRVAEIMLHTVGFVGMLFPKIAAGVFIAAALPLVLPRERIGGWIGADSGLRGLAFAAVAGGLIPGGPMMAIPLAGGLLSAGADLGASISFVTGWSLFSLNRTLIWELSFLPSHMVALRVALCLPFAVLCGLVARGLLGRRAT
jgi:uncharacterized membrane protein YraQ (UPF0718 family)